MRSLPKTMTFQLGGLKFAVIHGGVENISEFVFHSSCDQSKSQWLAHLDVDCVIGGHCGIPFGNTLTNGYWLNAGVIGMPANDGSLDGWYLILHPEPDHIVARWYRLPFDTGSTVSAMERAGLSAPYRDALSQGLWPSMDVLPLTERNQQGKYLTPAPYHPWLLEYGT